MLDSSFMIIKFYDMKYYRILGLPPREKKMKFSLFLNEIFIQGVILKKVSSVSLENASM